MTGTADSDTIFEAEVRRVAAELFPRAQSNGPVILEGRERDGVFNDGDVINIVEATTSKRKDKAERDLKKSADLVKGLRRDNQEVNFKIWFVTQGEPTADQASLVPETRKQAKCPVEICSYRVFSSKLVDASSYLQLRDNHPFGSIRKLEDDREFKVPDADYIPMDLLEFGTKMVLPVSDLPSKMIQSPQPFLLVGDFGSGKSMTMRHAYYALKNQYLSGGTTTFPLYLNLRDHFGQSRPSEALLRHGTDIGFALPSQLVAAWKAGHCHVFLDGFDELSSSRLVRGVGGLKAARREAMRLVYEFVTSHRAGTSIFISGRQNYFDSIDELLSALGVLPGFVHLTLNEFTQAQVETFLQRKGFRDKVPNWLPSRPLLLGYLAVKGVLSDQALDMSLLPREKGWEYLVERICEREARQIDPVSLEPSAVREFVERLATVTRRTNSGRGPIHLDDIHRIFQEIFAMPPDEKASALIFRMPGLTAASGQEDTREFIDDDYVDACRCGDVIRFINAPHDPRLDVLNDATVNMNDLGCSVAAYKLNGSTPKKLSAALQTASDRDASCLAFDVLRIMQQMGAPFVGSETHIKDGFFDEYQVTSTPDFKNIIFSSCWFNSVDIDAAARCGPRFDKCQIDRVVGCIGMNDLPDFMPFSANGVAKFEDEAKTNADILELPIPIGTKVLMTILRKLFVQAGRGRKENAFSRGLDSRAKAYVPEILPLLEQMGFASPHRISEPVVWFPNRSLAGEAHAILQAHQHSTHPLAAKVRDL